MTIDRRNPDLPYLASVPIPPLDRTSVLLTTAAPGPKCVEPWWEWSGPSVPGGWSVDNEGDLVAVAFDPGRGGALPIPVESGVTSLFGRTGVVVSEAGDFASSQIAGAPAALDGLRYLTYHTGTAASRAIESEASGAVVERGPLVQDGLGPPVPLIFGDTQLEPVGRFDFYVPAHAAATYPTGFALYSATAAPTTTLGPGEPGWVYSASAARHAYWAVPAVEPGARLRRIEIYCAAASAGAAKLGARVFGVLAEGTPTVSTSFAWVTVAAITTRSPATPIATLELARDAAHASDTAGDLTVRGIRVT